MRNWWYSFVEHFRTCSSWFGAIVSWLAIFFVFITAMVVFAKPYVSRIYADTYIVADTDINLVTEKDRKSINNLIMKNKIVPVSIVYEDTLRYYEEIIAILIALLGVFAVVSWFFMGGRMREGLHKEIQSKWFDICLNDKMSKLLKSDMGDYLAEQFDDEKIRSIAREEFEGMTNKLSDDLQEKNNAVLHLKRNLRVRSKKVGGK
ncbi:MAG: hypothetical protein J5620_01365 [Alphaproteobacteria bacterium]|nr:hypothetical protein [Alphaproteobacteria bacterium]